MEHNFDHIPQFLALLRAAIWETPYSAPPETDWMAIRQELKHHAIQNLPVDLLVQADPAHQMQYIHASAKACTHWYKLMGIQHRLTMLLQDAGIRCATIKGAAADIYYRQPLYRTMGDIDILVHPQDFQKTISLLVSNGYQLHDERNPRHTEFIMDGIPIEVHRHFATLSQAERVQQMDAMLFDALQSAIPCSIEGYTFSMLPPKENGIVLIEHINSHMEAGLGLRQIIDWMLYVDQCLDDAAWFGGFQQIVSAVGLEKLAVTVTRMCQLYLGLRKDITWCQLADEDLCQRLLMHTLQQGNFGRKQDRRSNGTLSVLNILDSDRNFFRILQRHGCHNWKALQRHPWLKPFAWAYQLCRYIRKGLRGKHPLRAFFRSLKRKSQNTDLLSQLEVQRKDHTLAYEE